MRWGIGKLSIHIRLPVLHESKMRSINWLHRWRLLHQEKWFQLKRYRLELVHWCLKNSLWTRLQIRLSHLLNKNSVAIERMVDAHVEECPSSNVQYQIIPVSIWKYVRRQVNRKSVIRNLLWRSRAIILFDSYWCACNGLKYIINQK